LGVRGSATALPHPDPPPEGEGEYWEKRQLGKLRLGTRLVAAAGLGFHLGDVLHGVDAAASLFVVVAVVELADEKGAVIGTGKEPIQFFRYLRVPADRYRYLI
jgi:hypothetical protein